jgi:serine O-acetyltransferase
MEFQRLSLWSEIKMDVAINNRYKKVSAPIFLWLLFFSPELQILLLYRLQHRLVNLPGSIGKISGKLPAKILWYISRIISSCDISPYAKIEGGIKLPHAVGIVVSEAAIIKSGTSIYQNVTVGAKNDKAPLVMNNVMLFPGCVVIGDIIIGNNVKIGANAVLVESVPDNKTMVGIPARELN